MVCAVFASALGGSFLLFAFFFVLEKVSWKRRRRLEMRICATVSGAEHCKRFMTQTGDGKVENICTDGRLSLCLQMDRPH